MQENLNNILNSEDMATIEKLSSIIKAEKENILIENAVKAKVASSSIIHTSSVGGIFSKFNLTIGAVSALFIFILTSIVLMMFMNTKEKKIELIKYPVTYNYSYDFNENFPLYIVMYNFLNHNIQSNEINFKSKRRTLPHPFEEEAIKGFSQEQLREMLKKQKENIMNGDW